MPEEALTSFTVGVATLRVRYC